MPPQSSMWEYMVVLPLGNWRKRLGRRRARAGRVFDARHLEGSEVKVGVEG